MKLTEFNNNPKLVAKKALQENFNTNLKLEKLDLNETKGMLNKVRGLIKETKATPAIHQSEQNPAYLKLLFMEQALKHHYGDLKTLPMYNPQIVVESEGVEQAQTVLAAKEMIDSVQKMIEDVSDMLVKELPAVTDSVNSEIGPGEGEQFNNEATAALTALGAALQQAKGGLQSAMNIVTGQGSTPDAFGAMPGADAALPDDMADMPEEPSAEVPADMPEEEPEGPEATIGRGKR